MRSAPTANSRLRRRASYVSGSRGCAGFVRAVEKLCGAGATFRSAWRTPFNMRPLLPLASSPFASRSRAFVRALVGPLAACICIFHTTPARAAVQTLNEAFNQSIHGGVVVDGWGGVSTTATFARGSLQVKLPAGATVRKAWFVSSTGAYVKVDGVYVANRGDLPPVPNTPREVIFSSGSTSKTLILEGTPTAVVPDAGYGAFYTDVTSELRAIVGTASGAITKLDLAERGDGSNDFLPSIYGHTIVVVYDLSSAPLRNVWVGVGALGGPTECEVNVTQTVALSHPTRACVGQPHPLSITVVDEPSNNDLGILFVNGTQVASRIGGADDAPSASVNSTTFSFLGEMTTGSFGAYGPLGIAKGLTKAVANFPRQTDDIAQGVSDGSNRADDELFDLRPVVPDGSTAIDVRYVSHTCAAMTVMAFQTNVADDAAGCAQVPEPCKNDLDCASTQFCDDSGDANTCTPKLANLAPLPQGSIGGQCTDESGARACLAGACESDDDRCGLLDGARCETAARCRSGRCTNHLCGGPPLGDAGGVDAADAGSDAGANLNGIGSAEGGGCGCVSAPSQNVGAPAGLAGLVVCALAARRKKTHRR